MLICMQPTTSVRIDRETHRQLKHLAEQLDVTVGETVAVVVRRFRQERIGLELSADLADDESDWLDADLG